MRFFSLELILLRLLCALADFRLTGAFYLLHNRRYALAMENVSVSVIPLINIQYQTSDYT